MTTYDEFLTTAAVPRETIDRFLDEDDPTWARFDGEVGYTLGRYLPRDGIDGSWTIFDSGLMEDLSAETYEAFAKDVVDSQARLRRLKKVGFWSISLAIQALFMGMVGNVA